jgi:putative phosphoribosyl transferase
VNSRFCDRVEAGQRLAEQLCHYANQPNVLVLGLPRGGVPVAYQIAKAIRAPLDVWLVRKLGVPGQEELAMGAIAMGGMMILNNEIINSLQISRRIIQQVATAEKQELERRDRLYRGERPLPILHDKTVILVDDGIATSSTLRAAIAAIQQHHPQRLVVAAPVAPPSVVESLRSIVDEVVCLLLPESLHSIGMWYEDFSQTTDQEVQNLLQQSADEMAAIGS